MTDDTTTIEITKEQRDELKALKAHSRESYKAVIGRLLEDDAGDVSGDPIGTNEFNELFERLSRIESAASTAEERTGSIENTLENMGGR